MHELGIATRILEVVLARAGEAGLGPVTDVYVELGEDSDVTPDALGSYWSAVSRGTRAEGARLVLGVATDPVACRVTAIDVADEPGAGPGG